MPGLVDPKIFKNAISIKDSLSKQQAKDISALYMDWASQIDGLADYYSKKIAPSYSLETLYQQQLKKQVTEMSKQVANGVYDKANTNLYKVADAVVSDNIEWMKQFGLGDDVVDAAFSNIPQSTVNALLTGSVYGQAGSWSLSKSIWSDNQDTLKKIYQIVAQGSVMQMPTGEIAKKLEEFVNPSKQFKWNGPSGYPPVYGKKVDYNAQRLARTLLQHCYQESFIAVSQKNPLITKVKYVANGSRACDVCKARDGKVYAITKVPLDHPNGMCVLEPVVNTSQVDKLAAWVKGDLPDKDKKWWDSKMKSYGYDVGKMVSKAAAKTASKVTKFDVQNALVKAEQAAKNVQKVDAGSIAEDVAQIIAKYDDDKVSILKKIARFADDDGERFEDYKDMFKWVYPSDKSGPESKKKFREMFRKMVYGDVELDFDFKSDEAYAKLANLYEKVFGKRIKGVEIDVDERTELMDRLFELLFSTDDKGFKALDLPVENFSSTKKIFKDFYGVDVDDIVAYKKAFDIVDVNKITTEVVKKKAENKARLVEKIKKATAELPNEFEKRYDEFRKLTKFRDEESYLDVLEEKAVELLKVFTEEEKKAIQIYTGSYYQEINAWLRSKDALSAELAGNYGVPNVQAKMIRDLIARMDTVKTAEHMTLRRGTDVGDLVGLFMDGDFAENKEKLTNMSADELNAVFFGQVGEYKAFTSTSSVYNRGFRKPVEIIFDAPPGTQGMAITSLSRFGNSEGEFLLNVGTKMKCVKIEKSDGHMDSTVRVFMQIIVD